MCILGVPWIWAGAEPEGYSLSYSISLKETVYKFNFIFVSTYVKSLPIFTANETITNLAQYELSQEESDLPKAGLYFSSNQIKFENPK